MSDTTIVTPELQMLIDHKEEGYNYRERRQQDWRENYTLYRDRVITNRLTQRQSVNIPLMKQTIRTLLKDVDDMPVLFFENLDNDKQAELYKNEYWKKTVEINNMELQDIVDKRQVFLFGRSFDQWQIVDGHIKMTVQDPQDILVSRYTDPTNINSSRFLIHTHIFTPLSVIEDTEMYDSKAVERLKNYMGTTNGVVKAADNFNMLTAKNEKMADMGLQDVEEHVSGETIIELTMYFIWRKEEKDDEEQIYLYITAEDNQIIMKEKLEDVIGKTSDNYWRYHYPYVSWADDVERQDFWSDAVADIVRTPNKVLNSWFSQLVENRTLRNFGMQYYDARMKEDGFQPQTYQPVPWGWYGVPGNPNEVMKKVEIPDLSDSLDEMQYVTQMVEKATGATATKQGATSDRQITLGEVKFALAEATERVRGMSKFYTPAWLQRGIIFNKLIEAGADKLDEVTIEKKGRNSNDMYTKDISPTDWMTKKGDVCKVWSQDQKNATDIENIQKLNMAKTVMPDNPKLNEAYQRKLLEFSGLTPNEINDIMEFEREKLNNINSQLELIGQTAPGLGAQPPQPQLQAPQPQATPII